MKNILQTQTQRLMLFVDVRAPNLDILKRYISGTADNVNNNNNEEQHYDSPNVHYHDGHFHTSNEEGEGKYQL